MTSSHPTPARRARWAALVLAGLIVAAGCSSDDAGDPPEDAAEEGSEGTTDESSGGEVVVISHDSFDLSEDLAAEFEARTGLTVRVQQGGDALSVVNQAILTADNPQGDLLFGIDDATLSRAYEADLFVPYEADGLDTVRPELLLDPEQRVTPIDHGAVCVNYDVEWFESEGVDPPETLADLAEATYDGLLAVPNPTTSSPGLTFLTATVAEYGEDGWLDYWTALRDNGVVIAADWSDAYFTRFSGGSGEGEQPLVVSYGSSPPAEVYGVDPLPEEAPTGVVEGTCARQIEFAGVLRNAENPEGAQQLIDFLLSEEFQSTIPLTYYVYPAVDGIELPEEFERFAVDPADPYQLDADVIAENRDEWLDAWTDTVLR